MCSDNRTHIGLASPVSKTRPVFDIPCELRTDHAAVDIHGITSQTSFAHVLSVIAEKLGTRVSHLTDLGYIPSWLPKTPKPVPKLLEDGEAWETLLDVIEDHIRATSTSDTTKGRKKKGGKDQRFTIILMDTAVSKKVSYLCVLIEHELI